MRLALDDTDSLRGGCTTHVAWQLIQHLHATGYCLRAPPSLVRLNPNIPYKTRGNGAVVLDVGDGPPPGAAVEPAGFWDEPVTVCPSAKPTAASPELLESLWRVVQTHAEPDASPALVMCDTPPSSSWYARAVQRHVDASQAVSEVQRLGLLAKFTGNGQALVGCLGALAWTGPPTSFELLYYRDPARPRNVRPEPLMDLDARGITFCTTDGRRVVAVPRGPDPVILGLRGDAGPLLAHAERLHHEACPDALGWLMFATNHGSGDHVLNVPDATNIPPYATPHVALTVSSAGQTEPGRHTWADALDAQNQTVRLVAFDATRLGGILRKLRPDDRVEAVGAWDDGAIRLERIRIVELAPSHTKRANPRCPMCGKSQKSTGRDGAYRCRNCNTKSPPGSADVVEEARTLTHGWHEAAVGARRHLHPRIAPSIKHDS